MSTFVAEIPRILCIHLSIIESSREHVMIRACRARLVPYLHPSEFASCRWTGKMRQPLPESHHLQLHSSCRGGRFLRLLLSEADPLQSFVPNSCSWATTLACPVQLIVDRGLWIRRREPPVGWSLWCCIMLFFLVKLMFLRTRNIHRLFFYEVVLSRTPHTPFEQHDDLNEARRRAKPKYIGLS